MNFNHNQPRQNQFSNEPISGIERPSFSGNSQQKSSGYADSFSGHSASNGVAIQEPSTFEEVMALIDNLKIRQEIIVKFTRLPQASAYRILDFLSGAVYALDGTIQEIEKNIFLVAPSGVAISKNK